MKVLEKINDKSYKQVKFEDSLGVVRIATMFYEMSDIVYNLYDSEGKALEETTYSYSTGKLLDRDNAALQLTIDLNNLLSNFKQGYIWKEYQHID